MLNENLQYKIISDHDEVQSIINSIPDYTDNHRYNPVQFEKYLDDSAVWYGCFKNNRCMALSVLKKIPTDDIVLLAEIQTVIKGYGKLLITNILSHAKNIWWACDVNGGEKLLHYYRQFDGLIQTHIKASRWADLKFQTIFYKATDDEHADMIRSVVKKADVLNYRKLFNEIVDAYKNKYNIDLSYMTYRISYSASNVDGSINFKIRHCEFAGCHTNCGYIVLTPNMRRTMNTYRIECNTAEDIILFTKQIIAHELAHEIWHNVDQNFKNMILDKAEKEQYTSVYLDKIQPKLDEQKFKQETFCEYIASTVSSEKLTI